MSAGKHSRRVQSRPHGHPYRLRPPSLLAQPVSPDVDCVEALARRSRHDMQTDRRVLFEPVAESPRPLVESDDRTKARLRHMTPSGVNSTCAITATWRRWRR